MRLVRRLKKIFYVVCIILLTSLNRFANIRSRWHPNQSAKPPVSWEERVAGYVPRPKQRPIVRTPNGVAALGNVAILKAGELPMSDNVSSQILCEARTFESPNVRDSWIVTFVLKVLGIFSLLLAMRDLAPLRLIIGRNLHIFTTHPNGKPLQFLVTATLECGHEVAEYGWMFRDLLNAYTEAEDARKKRHRCRHCQVLALAKKPARSVPCFEDQAVRA